MVSTVACNSMSFNLVCQLSCMMLLWHNVHQVLKGINYVFVTFSWPDTINYTKSLTWNMGRQHYNYIMNSTNKLLVILTSVAPI